MLREQRCMDCDVGMDDGFIVDFAYGGRLVSNWHPRKPEDEYSFGFIKSGLKINHQELISVTTLRCPQCGLLKSYAIKP